MTGRLQPLPALTREELDVLVLALCNFQGDLQIQRTGRVEGVEEAEAITRSLLTAVQEARGRLDP